MNDSDQTDERYQKLQCELRDAKLSDFDLRELDAWLVSVAVGQKINHALDGQFETASHSDRLRSIGDMHKAAKLLSDRLDFLGLPPSSEQELSLAWRTKHDRRSDVVDWDVCKSTLVPLLDDLVAVFAEVQKRLEEKGGKRGRPIVQWRNELVVSLFNRVKRLTREANDNVAFRTKNILRIYFPRSQYMEEDAILKAVQRSR